MRWRDSIGGYKALISLGSTCQTAFQLKRIGLRKFAGPFDWFVSEPIGGLVRLIENRFDGLMELDHMELIGATQECFVIRDNATHMVSFHDFPLHLTAERWREAYPAFKQTLNRRVQRLLKMVQQEPILFVRTDTKRQEAQELYTALGTLMRGKYQLLIVNHHHDNRSEIMDEDWGLDGICSVRLPRGEDWRGSNAAWDICMNGVKLKTPVSRRK